MPKCAFVKPDGSPCGAFAGADSPFCFMHDPDRAKQAAKARKRGGSRYDAQMGGEIRPPQTLEELADMISRTTKLVWDGKCDTKRAEAIVKLCKMQMAVIKQAREDGPPEDDIATMGFEELKTEARRLLGED